MLLRSLGPAVALGCALAGPVTAHAAPTPRLNIERTLTAAAASKASCATGLRSARSTDRTAYVAPATGFLTVRGAASDRSDWDLALHDAASGVRIASSQGFGSHEVAQVWVKAGQKVVAQACRRKGAARVFKVSIGLFKAALPKATTASLLEVKYRGEADIARLEALGLDVTHQHAGGIADVIAAGPEQIAALRAAGFSFRTEVADLGEDYRAARRADAAYNLAVGGDSELPSGRTTYRTYENYQSELKKLAEDNQTLVRPIVLPKKSFQGRELQGVEIARSVKGDDGRPVFFLMGVHHAREWPSGEAALEFAHLMVNGIKRRDPRITSLLSRARIVVVPLINPDGYIASRSSASAADTTGNGTLYSAEAIMPPGGYFAYRRKNCDGAIPSGMVPCELQYGVDPNRNYGEGWGGNGAGSDPITQSYRGTGPWSEPETQAVHEFSQRRNVTGLVTIHTVAALVLRPPGRKADGRAPDEDRMREVGDAMAKAAGYKSQYSFQLYDTSGTTEDWNYAAAGTYGYTIEMGPAGGRFHMPYETGVVDQWTGNGAEATKGKGLREALLLGAEAAANEPDHAILRGIAPAGRVLRLRKDFITKTSGICTYSQGYLNSDGTGPADCVARQGARDIPDFLDMTTVVPRSRRFGWHVGPSTRPFVGRRFVEGEFKPLGAPQTVSGGGARPASQGAVNEDPEATSIEKTITLPAAARATFALTGPAAAAEDYDLYILQDGKEVGRSAGLAGNETVTLTDVKGGDYVARVTYYAALTGNWTLTAQAFDQAPARVEDTGKREAYTLTCESADGKVLHTQKVVVERGQRLELGTVPCK